MTYGADEAAELPETTLCGGGGYCVLAKRAFEELLLPKRGYQSCSPHVMAYDGRTTYHTFR